MAWLLTQVLKVDPDLVHAAGEGPAEDDGGLAVEAEALELGAALLAARRHLAHADLVAHHLHRLHALGATPVVKLRTIKKGIVTICIGGTT